MIEIQQNSQMEVKNGHPINFNLIDKITCNYKNKINQTSFTCYWQSAGNQKFNRLIGGKVWPCDEKIKKSYVREDCNELTNKRLLFIIKGPIRDIPFIATVKSQWGTILDLLHLDGREETINLKDSKFDDLLYIRCLDAG